MVDSDMMLFLLYTLRNMGFKDDVMNDFHGDYLKKHGFSSINRGWYHGSFSMEANGSTNNVWKFYEHGWILMNSHVWPGQLRRLSCI